MDRIFDRAVCFAVQAHSGMTRKGSKTPYIVHPLEAACIAATLTDDEEVLAAAILHDTIEDTPVTAEEIGAQFGGRVCALVLGETEEKRPSLPAADTWQVCKQETIDALAHAGREEQILILSDKLSNLRSIFRIWCSEGDAVFQLFHEKDKSRQEWYYRSIAKGLTLLRDTPACREYEALLDAIFS